MKEQFRLVLGTHPTVYYYSEQGKFKISNEEIPVIDGKIKLLINGNEVEQCAILTALATFSITPTDISFRLLEGDMIDREDGYKLPNLFYRHRELIECEKKGFYRIPYHEAYSINHDGTVWSRRVDKIASVYVTKPGKRKNIKGGYIQLYVHKNDGTKAIPGRHRLLCLTFKRYPTHPRKLHVNHEDGVPGNDGLSNLNWCTPKENNEHAIENGLKLSTVKVLHKDLNTGKITRYASAQRCARALGKKAHFYNVVLYRMRECPGTVFPDGWLFKLDDGSEWPPLKEGLARQGNYNPVLVMDVFTRDITRYDNAAEVARKYGLKGDSITSHIRKNAYAPLDGKVFRYENDVTWPTHTEEQLLTYKDYPFKPPYGLRHTQDGKVTYYTSARKASEKFGMNLRALRTIIEKDTSFKLIPTDKSLGPDH